MIGERTAATSGLLLIVFAGMSALNPNASASQEPRSWRGEELLFETFSIGAVDPATGESGVAVTTRRPCVGNGVPWVRAGVGAVATQASTRVAYGIELLDLLERGVAPERALQDAMASDSLAERRQVAVISPWMDVARSTREAVPIRGPGTGRDRTTSPRGTASWARR